MTREEQMWQAVEQEHGKISRREALIALTAMEWSDKTMIDKACKCFCKTCRGQCKDNSHCDVFQVFRNELNAIEE